MPPPPPAPQAKQREVQVSASLCFWASIKMDNIASGIEGGRSRF